MSFQNEDEMETFSGKKKKKAESIHCQQNSLEKMVMTVL